MKKGVFTVDGVPVGKGRPRFTKTGHTYTPQKTAQYQSLVKQACVAQFGTNAIAKPAPVSVEIHAHFPLPKAAKIPPGSPHTKRPDLDNVVKAVLDAINGVAFEDDSQVSSLHATKTYSNNPHVTVTIKEE